MTEALFDIIAAGVPHRVVEGEAEAAEFARLGLSPGCTRALAGGETVRMRSRAGLAAAAEFGPAARLAVELACLGRKVAILDLSEAPALNGAALGDDANAVAPLNRSSTAHARRFRLRQDAGPPAIGFYYGVVEEEVSRRSALVVRAAKVLCLEDRLWDVEGGARFAKLAVDMAASAGRIAVLICKDAECCHRNRAVMREIADTQARYLVGEAQAILALHGFQRLDSLIPRLAGLKRGAVVWRDAHEPIVLDGELLAGHRDGRAISASEFWAKRLPGLLSELIDRGTLRQAAVAGSGEFGTHGAAVGRIQLTIAPIGQ